MAYISFMDAPHPSRTSERRGLEREIKMSKLNTVVFLFENDQIVETTIGECSGYVDETTTPRGVGPRLHVRGNELWTWGHQGNFPRKLREFDTEEEAQEALEESFVYDFWHADLAAFATREEAEQFLPDNAE